MRAAYFTLLILLAACGDSSPTSATVDAGGDADLGAESPDASPTDPNDPWSLPNRCDAITEIYCRQLVDVCNVSSNRAACEEDVHKTCDPSNRHYEEGLAAGRITYSPRQHQTCYEEALEGRCDLKKSCNAAGFEGLVEPGNSCNRPGECADDGQCVFGGQCPGTCVVPEPPPDVRELPLEGCYVDEQCEPDQHCRYRHCSNRDLGPASVGEPCVRVNCSEGDCCQEGLWCNLANQCQIPALENEPCLTQFHDSCEGDLACTIDQYCAPIDYSLGCIIDSWCEEGQWCDMRNAPQSPGICRSVGQQGEACAEDYHCAEELWCVTDTDIGHCEARAGYGEACFAGGCHEGWCSGQTGVCEGVGGAGNPCGIDEHCLGGLFCDRGTFTCLAPIATGEECLPYVPCVAGSYCSNDVCQELGALDAPCTDANPPCSAAFVCKDAPVTGPTCQVRGAIGQSCVADDCDFGLVCQDEQCATRPLLELDAACRRCSECEAGFICAGRCIEPLPAGSECSSRECESGYQCLFGVCQNECYL